MMTSVHQAMALTVLRNSQKALPQENDTAQEAEKTAEDGADQHDIDTESEADFEDVDLSLSGHGPDAWKSSQKLHRGEKSSARD